jgi:hypothetical protein
MPPIRFNGSILIRRFELMYKALDLVIDGATIDFFSSALNGGLLVAAGAFGWFVGALIAHDAVPHYLSDYKCA